jgi:hypothetical protein
MTHTCVTMSCHVMCVQSRIRKARMSYSVGRDTDRSNDGNAGGAPRSG